MKGCWYGLFLTEQGTDTKDSPKGFSWSHVPRNAILWGIFFSLGTPKGAENKWIRPRSGLLLPGAQPWWTRARAWAQAGLCQVMEDGHTDMFHRPLCPSASLVAGEGPGLGSVAPGEGLGCRQVLPKTSPKMESSAGPGAIANVKTMG